MSVWAQAAVALVVYAGLVRAAACAARADRPLAQALARLVTLLPAYVHELAHASVSIACTGRGRIRLHSVRHASQRRDGQVALGSSDIFYRGRLSNALVSAAPALLLWPLALGLAWLAPADTPSGAWQAACVGMLAYAGRLSDSDLQHLREAWHRRADA